MIPMIPKPEWSRDLIVNTGGEPGGWDDIYGWSKFSGGIGIDAALLAFGLKGTAIGETPISQLPRVAKDLFFELIGCGCFTEGTQIVVGAEYDENGNFASYVTTNIEDVKVGDYVYSYNTLTGETELCEVTSTLAKTCDHINYLTIVDEHGSEQIIEATDVHPFWVVTDEPDLDRAARDYTEAVL